MAAEGGARLGHSDGIVRGTFCKLKQRIGLNPAMSVPRALVRLTLKYAVVAEHAFVLNKTHKHPHLQTITKTMSDIDCIQTLMYDWDTDALVQLFIACPKAFAQDGIPLKLWKIVDELGDRKMMAIVGPWLGVDPAREFEPRIDWREWFDGSRYFAIRNARLSNKVRVLGRLRNPYAKRCIIPLFDRLVRVACRPVHRYAIALLALLNRPRIPLFLRLVRICSIAGGLLNCSREFLREMRLVCGQQDFDTAIAQAANVNEKINLRALSRGWDVQTT
ncbi:MAG: hypothetical protein KGL39_09295 [Patescibacteria group bacterium]|nr:hypothetical protein [Patescibacteria group bacterium]